MMTLNFNQMLAQLRGMDRLPLAALVLSAFALFYAGSLGLQWWNSVGLAGELKIQTQQLRVAVNNIDQNEQGSATTAAERQSLLTSETARFSFLADDDLIALVSDTSRDVHVRVGSAGTHDAGTRIEGPLEYRVVVLDARVEGQVARLFDFIDSLSESAPGLSVLSARMGGFGQAPWLVVELEFLLEPTAAPETAI